MPNALTSPSNGQIVATIELERPSTPRTHIRNSTRVVDMSEEEIYTLKAQGGDVNVEGRVLLIRQAWPDHAAVVGDSTALVSARSFEGCYQYQQGEPLHHDRIPAQSLSQTMRSPWATSLTSSDTTPSIPVQYHSPSNPRSYAEKQPISRINTMFHSR